MSLIFLRWDRKCLDGAAFILGGEGGGGGGGGRLLLILLAYAALDRGRRLIE